MSPATSWLWRHIGFFQINAFFQRVSLPSSIASKWEAYLGAERAGVRTAALAQLDAFVADLLSQPKADWQRRAFEVAVQNVDGAANLPGCPCSDLLSFQPCMPNW